MRGSASVYVSIWFEFSLWPAKAADSRPPLSVSFVPVSFMLRLFGVNVHHVIHVDSECEQTMKLSFNLELLWFI